MSIDVTDTDPRVQYSVGAGGQSAFTVPFAFFDTSDLKVYVDTTLQTITTDYTVAGGEGTTGTVTFVSPVVSATVTIVRDIPVQFPASVNFPLTGPFNIASLNTLLGKFAAIMQQLETLLGRSITLVDTAGDTTIQLSAPEAGKVIGWNQAEDALVNLTPNTDTYLSLTAYAQTILDAADAATARTALAALPSDLSSLTAATVAAGDLIAVADIDASNAPKKVTAQSIADLSTTLPRSYLAGLTLSNNGTDAAHDIDVAAGECRDAADSDDIVLSAITKRIDATWAAGTGMGGLSSSLTAPANATWYHVHAIKVSGAADVGFDTSVTAANLVTDHGATAYRRIGSVLTDGSANIIAFVQRKDYFWWVAPPLDVDIDPDTAAALRTLSVPTGVSVLANFNYLVTGGSAATHVYFSCPDQTDGTPSKTAAPLVNLGVDLPSGAATNNAGNQWVQTNTSSQIRSRNLANNTVLRIATLGWMDARGRNA